jgi:hypothetical protein
MARLQERQKLTITSTLQPCELHQQLLLIPFTEADPWRYYATHGHPPPAIDLERCEIHGPHHQPKPTESSADPQVHSSPHSPPSLNLSNQAHRSTQSHAHVRSCPILSDSSLWCIMGKTSCRCRYWKRWWGTSWGSSRRQEQNSAIGELPEPQCSMLQGGS